MTAALTRRRFVSAALSLVPGALAQQITGSADDIVFDARPLEEILQWAHGHAPELPPGWRQQAPYELARKQAKWNGRPDPDGQVLRQLTRIQQHRDEPPIKDLLDRTDRLLKSILEGRSEFLQRAVPHLHAYLPAVTPVTGTIALAAFLPNYAFSVDGTIVLSLTDRFWNGDAAVVWNLLVHELFHNGFVQHQRGSSPNDAKDGRGLVQALLWQVQNEGMATYVAWRAKPAELLFGDYKLLEKPDEVTARLAQCRRMLTDFQAAGSEGLPPLRDRLWQECNVSRVSYVAGAWMAQRIERYQGAAALVKTIQRGPEEFLEAYRRTSPGADLML